MSIGPRGYINPDSYINNNETRRDVDNLRNYMLTGRGGSKVKVTHDNNAINSCELNQTENRI